MHIKLPNGLIDGSDHFGFVEIDELRGKQQNYLANQELVVGNIGHIPKILEDMILSFQTEQGMTWKGNISEAIWKLSTGDIETILIKIRENTYGTKFYHEAICSHCEHHMKDLHLDLSSLKLDCLEVKDMLKPKKVKLPKSDKEVELKPLYLKDLFDLIKITNNNKDTVITSIIPLSMKSIKSNKDKEIISPVKSAHVDELPVSDLLILQKATEAVKLEGTIDTDIEIECSSCHKDFHIKLNSFDPSFFDPTRGSTSGTT